MSELLTVAQVAALLQVSPDTVMRRFAKVKGVVDIGSAETPKRRRYRIPIPNDFGAISKIQRFSR
jgi:hypothetical protein